MRAGHARSASRFITSIGSITFITSVTISHAAPNYESLGSFYLGREVDPATGQDQPDLLLYDSRDLTTHAVCVGMTGQRQDRTCACRCSKKRRSMAFRRSRSIRRAIIGNLLLTFPDLQPQDFAPWVDAGRSRAQRTVDRGLCRGDRRDLAQGTAGLGTGRRAHSALSRRGRGRDLHARQHGGSSRCRSFDRSMHPRPSCASDGAALGERIGSTVAGLLSLLGYRRRSGAKSRAHSAVDAVCTRPGATGAISIWRL